jgi:hypothetical protein
MAASGKVRSSSGEAIGSAQAAGLACCLGTIREAPLPAAVSTWHAVTVQHGAGTVTPVAKAVRSSARSSRGM